jgi:pentatricopeptide repeat protein
VAAQERAKTKAESQLPELMQKKREEALSQRGTDAYLKSGDIESAERWVQTMQQRGLY